MADNVVEVNFNKEEPPQEPTHMLMLTVHVRSGEEWDRVHEQMMVLSSIMREFPYVCVSSTDLTLADTSPWPGEAGGEGTLAKVQEALHKTVFDRLDFMLKSSDRVKLVTELITSMQNAGVLFRERV